MGNLVSSLVNAVGDLFRPAVDFLTGKSCDTVCGPTWDVICYIENFCVMSLIKLFPVLGLLFAVLLFLFILYKIGICGCIGKSSCKMLFACVRSCFSACEFVVMFLWYKIGNAKRIRREKRLQMEDYFSTSSSSFDDIESRYVDFRRSYSQKYRGENRRRLYMQKSLKARNHRIRVGISRNSIDVMHERETGRLGRRRDRESLHHIRVTHTSRFAKKTHGRRLHHKRW